MSATTPIMRTVIIMSSCLVIFIACLDRSRPVPEKDITSSPAQLDEKIPVHIREFLEETNDTGLVFAGFVRSAYDRNGFQMFWSSRGNWKPLGDSVYLFIKQARLFGLFPEDYHFARLEQVRTSFINDSIGKRERKDAVSWAKADVLLTDALFHLLKDIRVGRLPKDSITLRKDTALDAEFYLQQLNILQNYGSVHKLVRYLEPRHPGYHALKEGIHQFLDSSESRVYTRVPPPKSDPVVFKWALQKRLYEEGFLADDSTEADSATLAEAVKKFQAKKRITVDGKAGEGTVRMMNLTEEEKFVRIAISLDKYKQLPERMPAKYVWVNLAGYYLQLREADSIKLFSRIICGKPQTRTPLLTSSISEMITYPQWTVPASIIKKEILPAVKRNPGYLARKGFSLVDRNGEVVNPDSVDWSKYNHAIPYRVVQGSGDANALGVLKFNFNNKYAVYLHDTNQRYLFGNANRALSHGCVRVQNWEELALYILKNDQAASYERTQTRIDSMKTWLSRKEKRSIPVREKIPLFIRYFTVEAGENGIVFYDDIYGEDMMLKEKFFNGK